MAASCELEYPHHIHQFLALLHRFLRTQVRDTMSSRSRIVMSLFFSFVVSTLFANLSLGQQAGANRIALLFMVIMFPIITSVLKLPQYIATRAVYFREKGSHMYSALPYSLARWVAEFPLILLEMALLSVIVYFSTGLTREDAGIHFAVFLGTLLTVRLMTFSYVELMAGLVANPATATAITMLPLVICMLFAGFLIPKNSIPQGQTEPTRMPTTVQRKPVSKQLTLSLSLSLCRTNRLDLDVLSVDHPVPSRAAGRQRAPVH
jgi:hypothetical protein